MPSPREIKGKAALKRVKKNIPNLGSLTTLIRSKSPLGAITSCALTASVLGDVIDPAWFFKANLSIVHMSVQSKVVKTPKKSGGGLGFTDGLSGKTGVLDAVSLRQEQRVAKIDELLDSPKMVSITIIPDHHFIVFPISDYNVVVLQGFQGVYNLIEWMENPKSEGSLTKTDFIDAMNDFVGDGSAKRVAAAKVLFAFDYESEREVGAYYKDHAEISNISHKGL